MGFGRQTPKTSAAALLDELMGETRNADLATKAKKRFYENDVCKFYLCGLSPYHLLRNTRGFALQGIDAWVRHAYSTTLNLKTPETINLSSLVCDVTLKAQYDQLDEKEKEKFGYEKLLHDCLASLIRQLEKRVAMNAEKIKKETEDEQRVPEQTLERLRQLDVEYKEKIEASEKLGEVGEIEESMRLVHEAESIKAQKTALEETAVKQQLPDTAKRFVVCQTTGDLIESAAAADDAWMASHFESADFQGWKTVREWHAKLAAKRDGRGPPRGIPGYRGKEEHDASASQRAALASEDRRDRRDHRDEHHRHRDREHHHHHHRHRDASRESRDASLFVDERRSGPESTLRRRRGEDDDHHHRRSRRSRRSSEDEDAGYAYIPAGDASDLEDDAKYYRRRSTASDDAEYYSRSRYKGRDDAYDVAGESSSSPPARAYAGDRVVDRSRSRDRASRSRRHHHRHHSFRDPSSSHHRHRDRTRRRDRDESPGEA